MTHDSRAGPDNWVMSEQVTLSAVPANAEGCPLVRLIPCGPEPQGPGLPLWGMSGCGRIRIAREKWAEFRCNAPWRRVGPGAGARLTAVGFAAPGTMSLPSRSTLRQRSVWGRFERGRRDFQSHTVLSPQGGKR